MKLVFGQPLTAVQMLVSSESTACIRFEGCTANDVVYSKEVDKAINSIASGGQTTKDSNRIQNINKGGGSDAARADWHAIVKAATSKIKAITTQYGPGESVDLPGGGSASYRPGSTNGSPTIQVSGRPGFPQQVKIRY